MKNYQFFDHTSDVLFEAYGKTLNELFTNCALALEETQVDLKDIKEKQKQTIKLKNRSIEMLLFDFLQELIYVKDAKKLVFSRFNVKVKQVGNEATIIAECSGEKLDMKKHELKVDVKAMTLHQFYVKKLKDNWIARIILDI